MASNNCGPLGFSESTAYRILLMRCLETQPPSKRAAIAWTDADAQWATRSALEDTESRTSTNPDSFLAARADAAVGRLLSRTPELASAFSHSPLFSPLLSIAALAAFLLGLLSIHGVPGNRLDAHLLYVVGFIGFQLLVMTSFVANSIARAAGRPPIFSLGVGAVVTNWVGQKLSKLGRRPPNIKGFVIEWAQATSQLNSARSALTLHCASTAWALGMILGLWTMGLFKDYRAGWETTILPPATLHSLLEVLLFPATAFIGVGMLDLEAFMALRVLPGQMATGEGKVWIALMSATLLLLAFVPRALFAAVTWLRVRRLENQVPIDLADPYFQRLLWRPTSAIKTVQVLPHGMDLDPTGAGNLQHWIHECFGVSAKAQFTPSVPYGEEDEAQLPAVSPDAAVIVVFDMLATPEAEVQGRFLHRVKELAQANPNLLVVLDSSRFISRFANAPERLDQRRRAWQELTHSARWPDPISASFKSADDKAVIEAIQGALRTVR